MTLIALPSPAAFDYTHRGDYEDRPIVTVEFAAVDARGVLLGAYQTGVLVDSGADRTLLGYDVSMALGLDLTEAPKERVDGIAGGIVCAQTMIMAELCGRWFRIPAMFPVPPVGVQNCLGRAGVFDHVGFALGRAEKAVYCSA